MLALKLDSTKGLEESLTRISKIAKRSKSYLVQTFLEENIEDMELYFLGEQAYNEWIADDKKTYSLSEARKMINENRVE